jgi:Tol biopolymer transport system component
LSGGGIATAQVVVVNANGAGQRVVAAFADGSESYSVEGWSPDGRWLLLRSVRQSIVATCAYYKVATTGSTPQRVSPEGFAMRCAGASWR